MCQYRARFMMQYGATRPLLIEISELIIYIYTYIYIYALISMLSIKTHWPLGEQLFFKIWFLSAFYSSMLPSIWCKNASMRTQLDNTNQKSLLVQVPRQYLSHRWPTSVWSPGVTRAQWYESSWQEYNVRIWIPFTTARCYYSLMLGIMMSPDIY